MFADWIVTERYRDGTSWTHHFTTSMAARHAVELMQIAHPARSYAITYK
jgi:hypothetical protein